MAEQFRELSDKHIEFIKDQPIYFVGTAGVEGLVNVSPKGLDSLRILNRTRVAWLNMTGSGNESAAHVLENKRMTIMLCSFDKQPLILRLYGQANVVHPRDTSWGNLYALFPDYLGARQIFELELSLVQSSCGYAVPFYNKKGERDTLTKWSESRGEQGIREYWVEENKISMDNKETGIF